MKICFFLLIFCSSALQAECKNKIDQKKVILFIDMNDANPEIEKAKEGACARGEQLVIIPENKKELDNQIVFVNKAESDVDSCYKKDKSGNSCIKLLAKQNELGAQLEIMRKKNFDYKEMLKAKLESLKKSHSVIDSFIISGHDGGGAFGGRKGYLKRDEIQYILKDFPEVNKIQSALLLGCYTGVRFEVGNWLKVFPELRLLGGYASSAPLSDRPAGHDYIKELLVNEKSLLKKTDQKKLENELFIKIKSIKELHAGIYIKPQCVLEKGKDSFYFGSLDYEPKLEVFNVDSCRENETVGAIHEIEPIYDKYDSGALEPPSDTTNGELRKVYNIARRYQHCLKINQSTVDVNGVFNLLFFNGVKNSFTEFNKEDLYRVENILKDESLHSNELIKKAEELFNNKDIELTNKKNDYELLQTDPNKYLEKLKLSNNIVEMAAFNRDQSLFISLFKESLMDSQTGRDKLADAVDELKKNPDIFKQIWVPTAENIKNKTRKEILDNLHAISGILALDLPYHSSEVGSALRWTFETTTDELEYVINDPFSWHEYMPGESVEPPRIYDRLQTIIDRK